MKFGVRGYKRNTMKLSYISKQFTVLLVLLYFFNDGKVSAFKWKQNLEKALNEKTKIHQQLLLYENDFNNSIIYQIENNISKMIPTRVVDFHCMMSGEQKDLRLDPYLLQVTRLVIIPSENTRNVSKIIKVLDNVSKMSQQRTHPKTLIAITNATKIPKYKKFFQLCWSKQFLDISVLKLELQKEDKESKIADSFNKIDAYLRYYNPFTNSSVKTRLQQRTNLFPYKLNDLNGYELTAGVFPYQPYVNYDRNSTGHILKVHGPDINLYTTMAEVLNFSLKMELFNFSTWPKVNCTKEYNTGYMKKVMYNEFQFEGVQSGLVKACVNDLLVFGKGTRAFRLIILVPMFPNEKINMTTKWNLYDIFGISCLILSPWLISRCLNFDPDKWKLMYAIQIALGSATPKMPIKIIERITFILMIFIFLFQSSNIFSTLCNLQLKKETVHEIKTYEELYDKNLTLYTHSTNDKFENNDTAFEKIFNQAIYSENSFFECAKLVNDEQNVACYGREHLALLAMQRIRNSGREVKMKIFNMAHIVPGSAIYYSAGSPYPERFGLVSTALIESGISDKWDADNLSKVSQGKSEIDLFIQEISLTSKVLKLMIILLLIGYLCSFQVFVFEIFIHKYNINFDCNLLELIVLLYSVFQFLRLRGSRG
ncbi:uncharacterized protein LOC122513136 [Leptopilina heterotoma]|uniref:uncharacterized protein LOC122513136 n=1 Tax=Leptopilina heterotoma TaxID=63436 RepID=UPI001CA8D0D3|nr:uncharacterized protein LOC122513136 [Leptopilina heterotoma]